MIREREKNKPQRNLSVHPSNSQQQQEEEQEE
jgi:hypothetical protein